MQKMNINILKNSRQVSIFWREFVDNQKILWKNKVGSKAFQLACKYCHSKLAKILIQNSESFNIDLNSKNRYGRTPFLDACINGKDRNVDQLLKYY